MANKKIQPVVIGVFVVFSVFLIMAAIVIFSGGKFFSKDTQVIIFFEGSLQGLNIGAPVTYRGVTVGQVKDIRIHIQPDESPDHALVIPVIISLDAADSLIVNSPHLGSNKDISKYLKEMCDSGLRAKLKLVSLVTGKRYVDLAFYKNSKAVYRDRIGHYVEIPSLPSEMQQITKIMEGVDFDKLFTKVMRTFDSLDQLTSGLAKTLDNTKTQGLVDELSSTTVLLNQILVQLHSDIPSILKQVDSGLAQFNALTNNADAVVSSLDRQIDPIVKSAQTTLSAIDATVKQANDLLVQAQSILKPSSPLYYSATTAIQQLTQTADAIERLSEYIHRNPEALIFGLQNSGEPSNE